MLGGEGVNNENELLEPLATEAGQQAIARAINNLSSLEYAVRAERAATTATQKADEALNSAGDASDYATEARNWATKTDGYVDQETVTIPPEQEGDEPTTETIDLYSARYYAALAQDAYNNFQFDSVPTENSTALISSGAIYTALNGKADKSNTYTKTEVDTQISTAVSNLVNSAPSTLDTLEELADALGDDPNFATTIATQLGNKADKSDTYTKTEVDTALSNVQGQLTFDNVPTANSDNPVKSSGIKTALDGKQDTLTFDSTPTANSNNPVTSGGVYTALQNVNIDIDDEITEDSDNPVTSAAIYEALQNFTPSGGGGGAGNASGVVREQIWSGNSPWGTGSITLSKPISDFDFIEFIFHNQADTNYRSSHIVDSKKMQEIIGLNYSFYSWSDREKSFTIDSVTQFTHVSEKNCSVIEIYGIKFSKNLSEQMYSNVLYENANGWTSGAITLSDSLENYDFIEFLIRADGHVGSNEKYGSEVVSSIILKEKLGKKYEIDAWDERYIAFFITSNTSLTFDARTDLGIYKIIGYKMAKGGYSGIVSDARMTVKSGTYTFTGGLPNSGYNEVAITFDSPMPDANYEVFLTIGSQPSFWTKTAVSHKNKTVNGFTLIAHGDSNTISTDYIVDWIAIRPNSYTREGMVEDVLFSNASGVNSGTINLSGNISDYDLIAMKAWDGANRDSENNYIYPSSFIINPVSPYGLLSLRSGSGGAIWKLISDNEISIVESNSTKIYKITGIKFGRYVSGVAVDTTVTQNSDAVVTSGAVYDALQNYTPSGGGSGGSITVDTTITENSQNPVTSAAIYSALQNIPSGSGSTDVFYLSTYGNNPTFTCNSG